MIIEWESKVRSPQRLFALERSTIVGINPEDAFDRLIELAVSVTGAPRGVITYVNDERTTAISSSGFPEGIPLYAPIEHSFCRFVVATERPFMVEDAHNDPRTIGDPAIEAFAAVSWIGYGIEDKDGIILGTFCLMDSEPREWSPLDIQTVATLAKAASTEIALRMLQVELAAFRLGANS
jgi:sigma-B regulation protein RsbU (phosphoserine phosphatase)